jgi:soluble lytic murein transglycosylase-like protein
MPIYLNMRFAHFCCSLLLASWAAGLAAQEKPSPAAAPVTPAMAKAPAAKAPEESALAQQRRSIAEMEMSIRIQRQAVLKQVPARTAGESFFVSGPPAAGAPLYTDFVGASAPTAACDPLPAGQIDTLVGEAAKREEIDPALIRGVMEQESAFRPCAVSPKGAMGLMQLMPGTATQFGVSDPFDPGQSVNAGARFLKQLLQNYGGDIPMTLGAYNAGPAKVNEVNGVPPIPETMEYVRRVMMLLPSLQ